MTEENICLSDEALIDDSILNSLYNYDFLKIPPELSVYDSMEDIVEEFSMMQYGKSARDVDYISLFNEKGEEVRYTYEHLVSIINNRGCWGFSSEDEIYIWADEKVDIGELLSTIAHEIGHILLPRLDNGIDEIKASVYSKVASIAYNFAEEVIGYFTLVLPKKNNN